MYQIACQTHHIRRMVSDLNISINHCNHCKHCKQTHCKTTANRVQTLQTIHCNPLQSTANHCNPLQTLQTKPCKQSTANLANNPLQTLQNHCKTTANPLQTTANIATNFENKIFSQNLTLVWGGIPPDPPMRASPPKLSATGGVGGSAPQGGLGGVPPTI